MYPIFNARFKEREPQQTLTVKQLPLIPNCVRGEMTEDTKNQAYAVNQNAETRVFTRKDRHRHSRHFGHKMAPLLYDE